MDHQAFAQLLGNYGEFLGAIAVVVTLVYLAGQLRQNTNALKSTIYTSYVQNANDFNHIASRHASDFATIGKLSSLDQLSVEQAILWQCCMQSVFNQWEEVFLHYRAGSLDKDVYEAKVRAFQKSLDWAPLGGLLRQTWESWKDGYTEEFQRFMETEVIGKT